MFFVLLNILLLFLHGRLGLLFVFLVVFRLFRRRFGLFFVVLILVSRRFISPAAFLFFFCFTLLLITFDFLVLFRNFLYFVLLCDSHILHLLIISLFISDGILGFDHHLLIVHLLFLLFLIIFCRCNLFFFFTCIVSFIILRVRIVGLILIINLFIGLEFFRRTISIIAILVFSIIFLQRRLLLIINSLLYCRFLFSHLNNLLLLQLFLLFLSILLLLVFFLLVTIRFRAILLLSFPLLLARVLGFFVLAIFACLLVC
mmetsp:Transcript_19327/g.56420  ORF Transcript_19327/g.56420 Transcript_19327/m.56420 type:complete len:258 (-) Transcript_19327:616-1389(-)